MPMPPRLGRDWYPRGGGEVPSSPHVPDGGAADQLRTALAAQTPARHASAARHVSSALALQLSKL